MKFKVIWDQDCNCIMARIEGEIVQYDLENLATEIVRLSREHNCMRLINDLRKAKLNWKTMDIYEFPKFLSKWGIGPDFKRAIIANANLGDYRFFETISKNIGQDVRIFTSVDDARQWLEIE